MTDIKKQDATLPCQFKRGQVWQNPDGDLMMVTNVVSKFEGDGFTVHYVEQSGQLGFFNNDNDFIINNITRHNLSVPTEIPDAMESLGYLLKLSRKMSGKTLRQVEKDTGISNAYISQIESGKIKEMSFKRVVILSDYYNVSIERCANTIRSKQNDRHD